MLYTILYTTNSNRSFNNAELQLLDKSSSAWNRSHDVTGCLAYIEAVFDDTTKCQFIQVLEGSKDHVEKIFNQLKQDMRQKNLSLIKAGFIKRRKFDKWTMCCERIHLNETPFLGAFFALNDIILSQDGTLEENMLLHFMESLYKQHDCLKCIDIPRKEYSLIKSH